MRRLKPINTMKTRPLMYEDRKNTTLVGKWSVDEILPIVKDNLNKDRMFLPPLFDNSIRHVGVSPRRIIFLTQTHCVFCGEKLDHFRYYMSVRPNCVEYHLVGVTKDLRVLTIDHIIPKSLGGPNSLKNYQLACEVCNNVKGNKRLSPIPTHNFGGKLKVLQD